MNRLRGGLVFKAHRRFASLNSILESNKEEEKTWASKGPSTYAGSFFFSSLLLSSLELSEIHKSMGLKYEPASEPLHIYVKWLNLGLEGAVDVRRLEVEAAVQGRDVLVHEEDRGGPAQHDQRVVSVQGFGFRVSGSGFGGSGLGFRV